MDTNVPRNLVYDDEPLDRILYGVDCKEATPADIFELWCGGDDLSPECLDAVVAILAQEPEKWLSMEGVRLESIVNYTEQTLLAGRGVNPRELVKLARICHVAGRVGQAEAGYRQVLESNDESGSLPREERWLAMHNLAILLEQIGREAEAGEERMLCEAEMLLSDNGGGLETVRSLALKLYVDGSYTKAERLYRELLARKYQQPGTLVHLARVLLMQDRLPEARKTIADAWKLVRDPGIRQETPFYVLPRIFFFRILCTMLARGDYSRLVAALQRELLRELRRETWTIEPLITHFKLYLHLGDINFLEAIGEAINSAENMDRLNAFPVWTAGEYVLNI